MTACNQKVAGVFCMLAVACGQVPRLKVLKAGPEFGPTSSAGRASAPACTVQLLFSCPANQLHSQHLTVDSAPALCLMTACQVQVPVM